MAKDVIKYGVCALFMLATFTLAAQVNNERLKKRVTVYKDVVRVDSFLNQLSRQTGVGFSFNSKKISPSKLIAMKKGSYTMAECLALIQRHSGIHYAMMNNHIILVDNPPQEKYRITLPVAKKTTVAAKPTVKKSSSTVRTRTPSKPDTAKILTPKPDTLTRKTQNLSATSNDSALNTTPPPDTTKTVAKPTVADSLRNARAQGAKARQQAAAAAADAAAAAEEKNEAFTATNLMIGAAVLRPDIYDMYGLGLNIQFERFVGNKVSFTAAAGYHQILGEYIVGSKLDTSGIPVEDSMARNFGQIPVLLGARYYVVRPLYAAFEVGYTFKAHTNVRSYLTFSPSLGVKIPVGDSNIDINVKYLYMNGRATIPEKTKLEKGNFGIWCLRLAYAIK